MNDQTVLDKDIDNKKGIFVNNGLTFVDNLYWPTSYHGKHISLNKLQSELEISHFIKFKHGNILLGLIKFDQSDRKISRKSYSIGALLLNLYEETITDIIIVAKLSDSMAAIIGVKDGHIIPYGSELIDTTENIRLKSIELIETFAIGNIWSIGFGSYLYNDSEIIARIRNTNPHFIQPANDLEINLTNVWQHPKINKAVKKSQLQKIEAKYLNKNTLLIVLIIFCFMIGMVVAPIYLNQNNNNNNQPVTRLVIPKVTSIPATIFVQTCFQNVNPYFGKLDSWQMSKLSCDLEHRTATFTLVHDVTNINSKLQVPYSNDPLNQSTQLINAINSGLDAQNQISESSVTYNNDDVIINSQLKFAKPQIKRAPVNINDVITRLDKLNSIDGTSFTLITTADRINNNKGMPPQKIQFKISSGLSPLWLINNDYLANDIALDSITAEFDAQSGFYKWNLTGEIL